MNKYLEMNEGYIKINSVKNIYSKLPLKTKSKNVDRREALVGNIRDD